MRSWRPKDAPGLPNGLILFDGVCVLCSRSVQFVIERDGDRWFRFTPIQSPFGRALAERLGISPEMPETNAVILRGRAYFKADSAIEVLQRLPRRSWVRALSLAPRSLRDFIYDCVAQRRYRLFGRTDRCMVPTPDISARFVFDETSETTAFGGRLSPFQVLLGADFARLPAAVRRVHALSDSLKTAGRAKVSVAAGVLPWLVCRIAGLPSPGQDVPVEVEFHPDGPRAGILGAAVRRAALRQHNADRRSASAWPVGRTVRPVCSRIPSRTARRRFRGEPWLVADRLPAAGRSLAAVGLPANRMYRKRVQRTLLVRYRRGIPLDRPRHSLRRLVVHGCA